jgi:hypothetical protein
MDVLIMKGVIERLLSNSEILNPVAFLTERVPEVGRTFIDSLMNIPGGAKRDLGNAFSAGCGFLYSMLSYTGENLLKKAEGIL